MSAYLLPLSTSLIWHEALKAFVKHLVSTDIKWTTFFFLNLWNIVALPSLLWYLLKQTPLALRLVARIPSNGEWICRQLAHPPLTSRTDRQRKKDGHHVVWWTTNLSWRLRELSDVGSPAQFTAGRSISPAVCTDLFTAVCLVPSCLCLPVTGSLAVAILIVI